MGYLRDDLQGRSCVVTEALGRPLRDNAV
jgi:hypothetical protein